MRLLLALTVFAFLGGAVRAEEDDDDPKSSHAQPVKPKVDSKPANREPPPRATITGDPPKAAPPKPETKVDSKPEPKPAAKVEPKPEAKPEPKPAAKVEAKPEPKPEAKPEAKPEPKVEAKPEPKPAKVEVARVEPAKKKVSAPEPEPKAALPIEPAPVVGGRTVRVRLMDGSSVAGTVRAELSESLVIDCNLGLLSIPRARIASISYDAAGGAKRAPVQQLDDDLPPRKR